MSNTYFEHRSLHKYIRVGRGQYGEGGKEHDKSGAGEEGFPALCAGCEGSERDGTRPLIPYVVLCNVRLVRAWINRR